MQSGCEICNEAPGLRTTVLPREREGVPRRLAVYILESSETKASMRDVFQAATARSSMLTARKMDPDGEVRENTHSSLSDCLKPRERNNLNASSR